jgi:hypothetical protein
MLQAYGFRVALVAAVCSAAACSGSDEGVPDDRLGGLVVAPSSADHTVDLDQAAGDPMVLARALSMPHQIVAAGLGSHRFRGTSKTTVTEGTAVVEELSDQTRIEFRDGGAFHAVLENSKDYGRESVFADGVLYLRPGHGKFHRRPPVDDAEPGRIRDQTFATLGAYFELLAPGAELSDRGHDQVAGRAARKIDIARAPQPRERKTEERAQRTWRQGAVVREVSGTVWLDAETGAPLAGELRGVVQFARDDRRFDMALEVDHRIEAIGQPIEVETPAEDDTVATHERLRELAERERLLEGIAPPARRAPTPSNPTGVAAPAATGEAEP